MTDAAIGRIVEHALATDVATPSGRRRSRLQMPPH